MKGKILKKILAAALVMTLVSGAVPIAPVADMFGGVAVTANAEGTGRVYSGFTATAGTTAGPVDNQTILIDADEEHAKLVDGIKDDEANKWCVVESNNMFSVPVYKVRSTAHTTDSRIK